MPLTLTLIAPTTIPIEVDNVRLEDLTALSLDAIRRIPIQRGRAQVPLAELFRVDGTPGDDFLVWRGDLQKVKRIAQGLTRGRVLIEGNVGMHLAAEMRGGEVELRGDAGDWLGADMRGGILRVRGNAGHLVGAAYRGERRGMIGGEILIHGSAGHEVGRLMRRGLIAVGETCGDFVGAGMLAGTIVVGGDCGSRPGAGMKRGTLGLFGVTPPVMLPTFRAAGRSRPAILRLYAGRMAALGFPDVSEFFPTSTDRFCGDFLELGKGEILTR